MKNCRTEHSKYDLPYIEQLQSGRWLISTNSTALNCLRVPTLSTPAEKGDIWSDNAPVTIPQVAIVTVTEGTTIQCPGFNLRGPVIPDAKSTIIIIKNMSTTEQGDEIIDIQKELASNTTWEKLPYVGGEVDALLEQLLAQTTPTSHSMIWPMWHNQHAGKLMISLACAIVALIIIFFFITRYHNRPAAEKITIARPSFTA
jgi:hypothetical protein